MKSPGLEAAERTRVSRYWGRQFEKDRADRSLWTNNEIVARHIYRLISGGSEEHWLKWFFTDYLDEGTNFEKSLSICCGDGAHELALADTGRVRFVRGFDISEGAIAQAKSRFEKARIPKGSYSLEVADANNLQLEDRVDLILSAGALHHTTNLEGLLSKLSQMLVDDGYFVAVEYVGPNRFQWTDKQLNLINGILRELDPHYLKDNAQAGLVRPTIENMLRFDPSEAVRSEDILRLLPDYFTIEYQRNFNGTLMHQLHPLLNPELTNASSPDFDDIVRMVLGKEDDLIRQGVLPSDFVFAICRSKKIAGVAGAFDKTPGAPKKRKFAGCIDVFEQDCVAGWAADLNAPDRPLKVDIEIDERFEGTAFCDFFRQDVKEAGYGDGRKGFTLKLVPREASSQPHIARILVAGSERVIATRRYNAEKAT
ncbi:MAG: trans-aconitate 2-methyltransferase [Chthoniobacterales bacterium]